MDFHSDKTELANGANAGTNAERVGMDVDPVDGTTAFQADDEGSIPFTRSTVFRQTAAGIPTKIRTSVLGAPRSGRGGRRFKSCHSDQLPIAPEPDRDSYRDSFQICSFLRGLLHRIPCRLGLHAPPLYVGGACPACGKPQRMPEGWE
ncbi:MAG TPA: hypothetical protein VK620_20080 [Bradyrhizobium sp.]|nr:hypothetical protein [Bradyrhizobium sp.]